MSYDRDAVVWSNDPFKDDANASRLWLILNIDSQPFGDKQSMAIVLSTSGYDPEDWVSGNVPSFCGTWVLNTGV